MPDCTPAVLVQLICDRLSVTVPLPVPISETVRVTLETIGLTVSVVLELLAEVKVGSPTKL